MPLAATTAPDPGWYPDPHDACTLRWWDGAGWTSFVAALPADGVRLPARPPSEPPVSASSRPAEPAAPAAGSPRPSPPVAGPHELPGTGRTAPPDDRRPDAGPRFGRPAPGAESPRGGPRPTDPAGPAAPADAGPAPPFVASVPSADPGAGHPPQPGSDAFRAALASARAARGGPGRTATRPAPSPSVAERPASRARVAAEPSAPSPSVAERSTAAASEAAAGPDAGLGPAWAPPPRRTAARRQPASARERAASAGAGSRHGAAARVPVAPRTPVPPAAVPSVPAAAAERSEPIPTRRRQPAQEPIPTPAPEPLQEPDGTLAPGRTGDVAGRREPEPEDRPSVSQAATPDGAAPAAKRRSRLFARRAALPAAEVLRALARERSGAPEDAPAAGAGTAADPSVVVPANAAPAAVAQPPAVDAAAPSDPATGSEAVEPHEPDAARTDAEASAAEPRPPRGGRHARGAAAALLAAVAGVGGTAIYLNRDHFAAPQERSKTAQRTARATPAADLACLRTWNVDATESAAQLRVTLGQFTGSYARIGRVDPLGGTLMEPDSCALTVYDPANDVHATFVAGVKGRDGYLDVTSYPRAAEYGWPKSPRESNVRIQPDGSLRAREA